MLLHVAMQLRLYLHSILELPGPLCGPRSTRHLAAQRQEPRRLLASTTARPCIFPILERACWVVAFLFPYRMSGTRGRIIVPWPPRRCTGRSPCDLYSWAADPARGAAQQFTQFILGRG